MKKVEVKKELCIACGACVAIDDEHFDFADDGLAYVKKQDDLEKPAVKEAIEACPTDAIACECDGECNCE